MFTTTQKKMIALSSLGGALEFYDFVVFVFMAKVLGELFFPEVNPIASLMASLAVFAIGYLARPLGGILFGHFGDKAGRKKTFVATVLLMAIPTFLIGLLPTYHNIGITASILLVILRLIQGLSIGGEIPGAIVFVCESVAVGRRGFATALILLGINSGLLAGSFISGLLNYFLTHQQVLEWGWRIPFFIGGSLGIVSYFLRRQLRETPVFQLLCEQANVVKVPCKETIHRYPAALLQGIALSSLEAVIISITILFFPTYLATFFHFPLGKLLLLNTFSILAFLIPVLIMGRWSDKIGRKKLILVGILFYMFLVYPLFYLFHYQVFSLVVLVSFLCSFFSSFVIGVFPCMNAELFPTKVRYSGVAISYNVGFGIIGGLAPLVATALINWSGNLLAPGWVLIFISAIALLAWFFTRETAYLSLEEGEFISNNHKQPYHKAALNLS